MSSRISCYAYKKFFLKYNILYVFCWWFWCGGGGGGGGVAAIKLHGVADMLHNFEAIDPDVLNVFAFKNRPAYRRKADVSEMDIMELDTSDILNCFSSLSYTCFQKKIIFYLDSLNRVDKINLFGGYISFVRVSQGVSTPITEQMLASRHITDEMSLGGLLKELFDNFVDGHILRITVPVINARLDARSARGHCYDFSLGDAKISNDTKDTQRAATDPTCYRGDQSTVALSSALVVKMLMLLPTLLKVIAAKAIFGLVMGVMSVILSKMAILPLLLSYTKKNYGNPPNGGSYRQGVNPTAFSLTTDSYGLFYQQEEQPGRITTAAVTPSMDSNIGSSDYGPSAVVNDNVWSETKFSNKNYANANNKELKYVPRKDRYRSAFRRSMSNPKRFGYAEMVINGRAVDAAGVLTTAETRTESNDQPAPEIGAQAETPVRAKRWLGHTPIYIADLSY